MVVFGDGREKMEVWGYLSICASYCGTLIPEILGPFSFAAYCKKKGVSGCPL